MELFTLVLSLLVQLLSPVTPVDTIPINGTTTATVLRVIDGDTIDVLLAEEQQRVRYIGIDTPEPYAGTAPECFAAEASAANKDLVEGRVVQLVADQENTDRYDRLLRYVYVDEILVNAALLEDGYATTLSIPPNTAKASYFSQLQNKAKADQVGLWETCR